MASADDEFDRLFRAEYPSVRRAVRMTVATDAVADEITQEAFCRALERWKRVSQHPNPGGWVQLTALRMAVRSERRRRRGDDARPAWRPATVDRPADLDLADAIAALARGQRHAVVLHHLVGLPVAEVAEVMGVSPGTVKTHLSRGRANLETALAEEADDVAR